MKRGSTHPDPTREIPPLTGKNKSESFDFVVGLLEQNPEISYAEVAKAASEKGFKIYPIVYGRAKAKLGLVPTAPRGTGAAARAKQKKLNEEREADSHEDSDDDDFGSRPIVSPFARPAPAPQPAPPRPFAPAPASPSFGSSPQPRRDGPAQPAINPMLGGIESVISHVKASEAQRERFRQALVKIQAILEEALRH
jgi:hypothetical protein